MREWVGKICDFWPISRCISVTVQDRALTCVTFRNHQKIHKTPYFGVQGH